MIVMNHAGVANGFEDGFVAVVQKIKTGVLEATKTSSRVMRCIVSLYFKYMYRTHCATVTYSDFFAIFANFRKKRLLNPEIFQNFFDIFF